MKETKRVDASFLEGKELIAYVKALPEYDDEIFRKITGADDEQ